jgi:hypothetical protein
VYSIIRALAAGDLTRFDRCQCARRDERWVQVIAFSSSYELATVFMLQGVRSRRSRSLDPGSNSTFP